MASAKHFIWYELHRPSSILDMALPEAYREGFSGYVKAGEIPHLLFFGPAGSGKTTMAFILMEALNATKLILNASSNDRSMATMKGKVKTFASSMALNNKPKIILFDEADGILADAQRALKNTIETYSSQCRFIFTCNEIDRIDPAIKSRCIKYEFTAFPHEQLIKYLEGILIKEKVSYNLPDIEKIIEQNYPDIRSIVNTLQLCSTEGKLDPEVVSRITVDPNQVLDNILDGQVGKLRVLLSGVSDFNFIYKFLYDIMLGSPDVTDEEKKEIVALLSEHLFRDASVVNREINFIACAIGLMGVLNCQKISFL